MNPSATAAAWTTFPLFAYGYAGVGLFFVLSGFCIHWPQARRFHASSADRIDWREYGRRRFWRLYPAFAGSLLLSCLALAAMNLAQAEAGAEWSVSNIVQASGADLILPNALFLLPVQPGALALNGVYWTLIYEVQFYLVYPALLALCRRRGFVPVAVVLFLVELAFLTVPTPPALQAWKPHFEWFFPRRHFEWFLGMWLAERVAAGQHLPRRWTLAGAILLALAGIAANAIPASFAYHELLFACASAALLAWVIHPHAERTEPAALQRLLGWFGDFSYSIYLVHLPVFRLVFALADGLAGSSTWGAGLSAALALAAVILVARGLFVILERPYMPKPKAPGNDNASEAEAPMAHAGPKSANPLSA